MVKIVALLCNWCSYAGADLAGVSRYQYPPTIRVIRVMCSTRVEPSFVIKAFMKGADGVLVGGCHLGDCHYVTGNYYTIGKMNMAKRLLRHAGIEEDRLSLQWISASEGEKFAKVVKEFTEKLKEFGTLKKDDLSLQAAFNVSLKPRIRILATKEIVFGKEANRYKEWLTSYEIERLIEQIVYDEINEEKIRILLKEREMSLEEIAERLGMEKKIIFQYLIDFIDKGEISFIEKDGIFYFYYDKKERRGMEVFIPENGYNEKGIVIIGAGVKGIKKAIEFSRNGKKVMLIERFPVINENVIRKHLSSLNDFLGKEELREFKKLVEENKIKIITNSMVKKIENGIVKIINYPTRVEKNCNACNICYEVCPIKIVDRERSLFTRKAVYGRKGVPSMYLIERETPFCQTNCPAHVDVRGYVARIAEGKFEDALRVIRERLPLPGVLGRVCPNPCEEMCKRNGIDEAISIRLLKRFVADYELKEKGKIDLGKAPINENSKYKIAIIGSGPAGLTAAYELAKRGYKVKIFEALPVAGGMLAVGIPSYRLPKDILKKEIDAILQFGVEIELNKRIGREEFEKLRNEYDAIFISVGAHKSKKLNIEGEDLKGVIHGVDFLREVNISPENVRAVFQGRKVVIIGGGDVAIDAARCALRLGGEVTIIYRRSRAEMPAREEEIKFAEEEGVNIRYLTSPLRIVGKDGRVVGIECIEMELGEMDESGRRKPVPKKGSEFFLEADMVIVAIGQEADLSFLPDEIKKGASGIIVDENTGATSMKGVFAGGDAVTGPSIVIEAVAWGRKVANAIHEYLHNGSVSFDILERNVNRLIVMKEDIDLIKRNVVLSGIERKERKRVKYLPIQERITTFKEVEMGFDKEEAIEEARRCLSCRECLGCGICGNECPQNAIEYERDEREIVVESEDIIIDEEIYFEINEDAFTPFEIEDMMKLGILMDFEGRKIDKVAFINENDTNYIKKLKEKLKEKGIEVCNEGVAINCKFYENEYYRMLKRYRK